MALTLADIERWDASSLREVAAALAKKGATAGEVRTGLTKLSLIASWHRLYEDARAEGFNIDPVTGEVTPADPSKVGDPIYAYQQAGLEVRVKELLAAAEEADDGLARAISDAGGHAASPDPPNISDVLAKPIPEDPKAFYEFWERLTPAERDALYARDPLIANHDGMPGVDSDYYNRKTLASELPRAEAAQARVDALKAQHPDWADGKNIPQPNKPGAIFDDRLKFEAWQRDYDAAQHAARYLPDLRAVDNAVRDQPDRKLMRFDTETGRQVRAAIAVGDPDTADHVSVSAPGLNTTVAGAIEGMADEASNVRSEAQYQLDLNKRGDETVAAIAWIGYDPPQIPGTDDLAASLAGGWEVSHEDVARAGAQDLAGFYDSLNATHQGEMDLTAIGHSYG
ncbi:alpha/beta hydrolase [Mycolicibacterium goodii]|uniref:alpha/beta hydrolase n=1 Tax=Mycolicibacterium goodii TaxID=134601 RepID=UPI00256EC6A5|nr:alpha/beta hydrolase [Mycolicibacterium goodii]